MVTTHSLHNSTMSNTTPNPPPPPHEPCCSLHSTTTTTTSASVSPLTVMIRIPELASTVAKYFSQSDLSMCIRVNKTWFEALVPHLWETVSAVDFDFLICLSNGDTDCEPWTVDDICNDHPLRKYGRFIKHLTLRYRRSLCQLGPSLVSLRTLVLDDFLQWAWYERTALMQTWKVNNHSRRFDTASVLVNIFRRNPALHTVKLALAPLDDIKALADALGDLQELEYLVLGDSQYPIRTWDLERVMQACSRAGHLRRIQIDSSLGLQLSEFVHLDPISHLDHRQAGLLESLIMFQPIEHEQYQEQQFGIEQLELIGLPKGEQHFITVLERCGQTLQTIFAGHWCNRDIRDLIRVIPMSCPYLRHIGFIVAKGTDPKLWITFLKISYPLESLKVIRALPIEPLLEILQKRHAASLRSVHFERCDMPDAEDKLVKILEFCPRLREFWSDWPVETSILFLLNQADDHFPSVPWVCTSALQRLCICFRQIPLFLNTPRHQDFIQRQLLGCILRAKGLQALTVITDYIVMLYPDPEAPHIAWDEALLREEFAACAGLGALQTLRLHDYGFDAIFA